MIGVYLFLILFTNFLPILIANLAPDFTAFGNELD